MMEYELKTDEGRAEQKKIEDLDNSKGETFEVSGGEESPPNIKVVYCRKKTTARADCESRYFNIKGYELE